MFYIYKNLIIACFLISSSAVFGQQSIEDKLVKYRLSYLPEKVFVHTDKEVYAAGETIWMAIYLMDGQTHQPTNISAAVRVELHDDKDQVVLQQVVHSEDGHISSEMALPDNLRPGDYQLAAFTNNQRNLPEEYLFVKPMKVIAGLKSPPDVGNSNQRLASYDNSEEGLSVRFFPESGDCIAGLSCRMAFVVENGQHQPVEISGHVADEKGISQAIFKSNQFGIGTFNYLPETGASYEFVDGVSQKRFDLPEAKSKGFHLTIQKAKGVARFIVQSNLNKGLENATLIIHLRGVLLLEQTLTTTNQKALLDIPLEDLAEGVLVATIFDSKGLPRAERLFFVSPDKAESSIEIRTNATAYKRRDQVEMSMVTHQSDLKDESMSVSRLSISVLPEYSVSNSRDDIRSYLLLNSDLDFPIEQSSDLIYQLNERLSDKWIDDFLLTRGWRRFNWEKLKDNKAVQRMFRIEQGVHVQGRMSDFDNVRQDRPGKVFLTRMSNAFTDEVVTDENAIFNFGPYDLHGTVELALNGRFKLGKKNRLSNKVSLDDNSYCKLEILPYDSPQFKKQVSYQQNLVDLEMLKTYKENSQKVLDIERAYEGLTVDLENVNITAKKIERSNQNITAAEQRYGQPDARVKSEDIADDLGIAPVFNMLRRVAGVRVTGSRGQEQIIIRGISTILAGKEPLYIVDGVEVDINGLRDISSGELDFIDVLTGAGASFYGSRASNGVIVVYTNRGNFFLDKKTQGLLYTKVEGYHEAKEFAVFDYDGEGNQNRPDFRTTLHWNGDIRTNVLGEAKESFITSDQFGKYIILVQGLRSDGQPLYGKSEFTIE